MIGVTIYKYDDNLCQQACRAIRNLVSRRNHFVYERLRKRPSETKITEVDTMIAKGAKSLAINWLSTRNGIPLLQSKNSEFAEVVFLSQEPKANVCTA